MKEGKLFPFSLGNLLVEFTVVLMQISESKKLFWLKRIFPKKQSFEKQDNPNILTAVGAPPAEQVMGKAIAYGSVDLGFHSATNLVVSGNHLSHKGLDAYESGQGLKLPNTSPLSKEEMLNIVPFRKYTFYSAVDTDIFAKYNGMNSVVDATYMVDVEDNQDIEFGIL